MNEFDNEEAASVSAAMFYFMDNVMHPVASLTIGYRTALINGGFDEAVTSLMCADLHRSLLQMVFDRVGGAL